MVQLIEISSKTKLKTGVKYMGTHPRFARRTTARNARELELGEGGRNVLMGDVVLIMHFVDEKKIGQKGHYSRPRMIVGKF